MKKLFFLILSLSWLFFLQNCKKDIPPITLPVAKLDSVKIFLDNSQSMSGYYAKDAEFKTIISDLAVKIDKNIKPVSIWFSSDSDIKYNKNAQAFSSDIATTNISNRDGYQLHEMIKRIADKTGNSQVSILVSDCILSFNSDDIKKNPQINKIEAPNALKNNVFSTFTDIKNKNFGTSIYAFKSKFYGTYFNYQNGKKVLNGESRPFYLVFIGNKEILNKLDQQLKDISTFKPEKYLQFGFSENPVTTFNIIPQIERKGKFELEDGAIEIEDPSVQFCAVGNLKDIPTYAKEISYLQNKLKVEATGCNAKIIATDVKKLDQSKLKSPKQIEHFTSATNAFLCQISDMKLKDGKLHIYLPKEYDTWFEDWSVDDDITNSYQDKTFAFKYFINGVIEAYDTKNKNYIDWNINLKK